MYHRGVALVEPAAPDASWPRYSRLEFPPYRFVAGLNPHPRRDPRGHSHGQPEPKPAYIVPERWRENGTYLFGVDLHNFAYWWECHEQLEALWHLTGHKGREAQFLQGVIQAAAANLKRHMGSLDGSRRLAGEAMQRLASVGATFMGLRIGPFIRSIQDYHIDGDSPQVPMIRLE